MSRKKMLETSFKELVAKNGGALKRLADSDRARLAQKTVGQKIMHRLFRKKDK